MSGKRPSSVSGASKPKKARKSISLKVKMEVLNRFDASERSSQIASALGLPATIVRTIIENADKIGVSAKSVTLLSASKITKGRHTVFEEMETLLGIWIQDHIDRNMPVIFLMI
jgi:hypothetical protein